jgi:branched-chain amino acid transport system substrate-binding protein
LKHAVRRAIAATALTSLSLIAHAADTLKIAFIDPLTGPPGLAGQLSHHHFEMFADELNAKGGVLGKKMEIVVYENKGSGQESQIQAQKAVDDGIRFFVTGIGSAGVSVDDFVARYNERNPDKRVLFINYSGSDPLVSNEKCSWWQTTWDATSPMKIKSLVQFVKTREDMKKIYLINQDYGMGQSSQASARAELKNSRSDIQVVGDELFPLLKVNDFSPYIAKIKASGADTVMTSAWGQDLALLLKASGDAGLSLKWVTIYAAGPGGPASMMQAKVAPGTVFAISEGDAGVDYGPSRDTEARYRARYGAENTIIWPRAFNAMQQLVDVMNETKSMDPNVIAAKLNGRHFKALHGGDAYIRTDNNSVIQPLYISSFGPLGPGQRFDEGKTGWGWKTVMKIPGEETVMPTTCKLKRPS